MTRHPGPLTPQAAAWIRDHAWTQPMRKVYRRSPGYYTTCACQYGLTSWCRNGQHDRCHRATPRRAYATVICAPGGIGTAAFPQPYEHVTDVSATGPRHEQEALVWLADRVCRWVCPCGCHTGPAPARPVQLDLWGAA